MILSTLSVFVYIFLCLQTIVNSFHFQLISSDNQFLLPNQSLTLSCEYSSFNHSDNYQLDSVQWFFTSKSSNVFTKINGNNANYQLLQNSSDNKLILFYHPNVFGVYHCRLKFIRNQQQHRENFIIVSNPVNVTKPSDLVAVSSFVKPFDSFYHHVCQNHSILIRCPLSTSLPSHSQYRWSYFAQNYWQSVDQFDNEQFLFHANASFLEIRPQQLFQPLQNLFRCSSKKDNFNDANDFVLSKEIHLQYDCFTSPKRLDTTMTVDIVPIASTQIQSKSQNWQSSSSFSLSLISSSNRSINIPNNVSLNLLCISSHDLVTSALSVRWIKNGQLIHSESTNNISSQFILSIPPPIFTLNSSSSFTNEIIYECEIEFHNNLFLRSDPLLIQLQREPKFVNGIANLNNQNLFVEFIESSRDKNTVTLSCASTSIPASSQQVEWWFNGETVLPNHSQQIIVPTTLKTNFFATYQCWVSNAVGVGISRIFIIKSPPAEKSQIRLPRQAAAASSSSLLAKPIKVQNLHADSDETNIYLSWSKFPDSGTIDHYRVRWGKSYPGPSEMKLGNSQLSAVIKGLDSSSKYLISVLSFSPNNEEESAFVECDTKSKGYKADLGIPLNVVSYSISKNSAVIHWEEPQRLPSDSLQIHKYEIEYYSQMTPMGNSHIDSKDTFSSRIEDNKQVQRYNVSGDKNKFRIENLISGLTYRCRVRSYYSIEPFPLSSNDNNNNNNKNNNVNNDNHWLKSHYSMEHTFATQNIAPVEPPRNITIRALDISVKSDNKNDNSEIRANMQVSWQPPESPPRTVPLPIRQYVIFFSADPQPNNNNMAQTSWMKLNFPGHQLTVVIPQLLPDTYYYLYMYAENEIGMSPSSPILVFRTTNSRGIGGGQVKLPLYMDLRHLFRDLVDTRHIYNLPLDHGRRGTNNNRNTNSMTNAPPPQQPPSQHSSSNSASANKGGSMESNKDKWHFLSDDKLVWYIAGAVAAFTILMASLLIIIVCKCRQSSNSASRLDSNGYKLGNKHLSTGRQDELMRFNNGHAGNKMDSSNRKNGSVITNSGGGGGGGGCDSSVSPLLCNEATNNRYAKPGTAMHLPDIFYHPDSVASGLLMQHGHGQHMIELERCKSNSDRTSSDDPDLTSVSQRHLFPTSAYHSPNSLNESGVLINSPPNVCGAPYGGGVGGMATTTLAMTTGPRHMITSPLQAPPGSPQHHNMVYTHGRSGASVNTNYSLLSAPSLPSGGSPHMAFVTSNVTASSNGTTANVSAAALLVNTSMGTPQSGPHHMGPPMVTIPANVPRVNASELNSTSGGGGKWPQSAANTNSTAVGGGGVNNMDEDELAHRRKYDRKEESLNGNASQVNRGSISRRSVGFNSVDRASVLSQSDHEIPKNFSTEELSQEMANLEGLMRDLKAITQKEFEC